MNLWKSTNKEIREMEEKKLEFAISRMVGEVNLYSRYVERAKIKNLPMIERDYFSRILGIDLAMFNLGYRLEKDGKRADRKNGLEYMHYKAVKDKELWKWNIRKYSMN